MNLIKLAKIMLKTQSLKFSALSSLSSLVLFVFSISPATADAAKPASPSPKDLDKIEIKLLDCSYPKEPEEERLGRLEQFVFGAKRSGTLDSRLANLEKSIAMPEDAPPPHPASTVAQTASKQGAPTTDKGGPSSASKAGATANGAQKFASYDYGKYPRVAELEKEWLGKTFETEPLQQRVTRLETRMFGKPSPASECLCDRIDRLDEFSTKMVPTEVASAPDARHYANYGQQSQTQRPVADSDNDSAKPKNPFTPGTEPPESSVFQRTSIMERLVFGHDHGGKPLAERVGRLEKKLVPYEHNAANQDLTKRINNLWTMMEAANEPER